MRESDSVPVSSQILKRLLCFHPTSCASVPEGGDERHMELTWTQCAVWHEALRRPTQISQPSAKLQVCVQEEIIVVLCH